MVDLGLQGDNIVRIKSLDDYKSEKVKLFNHPDYVTKRQHMVTYITKMYSKGTVVGVTNIRVPEGYIQNGKQIDLFGAKFFDDEGGLIGEVIGSVSHRGLTETNVSFSNELIHRPYLDDDMGNLVTLTREQSWKRRSHFKEDGIWNSL